jgi:hypothetical protein
MRGDNFLWCTAYVRLLRHALPNRVFVAHVDALDGINDALADVGSMVGDAFERLGCERDADLWVFLQNFVFEFVDVIVIENQVLSPILNPSSPGP